MEKLNHMKVVTPHMFLPKLREQDKLEQRMLEEIT